MGMWVTFLLSSVHFSTLHYISLFLQSTCGVSVIRKRSDRTKKELTKGKIPFEMARNDNCLNFFFCLNYLGI